MNKINLLKDRAYAIIKSGEEYIKKYEANGYVLKSWEVKKAIDDYHRGRTRWTSKDVTRLRTIFNRARLRSQLYKTETVSVDRTIDKYGGIFSYEHQDTIFAGTASMSKESQAKNIARQINKLLRDFDKKYSYMTVRRIKKILFYADIIIYEQYVDPIDIYKITEDDYEELLRVWSELMELTELSPVSKQIQDDEYRAGEADLDIEIPDNIDKPYFVSQLKQWLDDHYYDSDQERQIKTWSYNTFNISPDREFIVNMLEYYANINNADDLIKSLVDNYKNAWDKMHKN